MKNDIKSAIVVGSGFGGLAAALRLKYLGYDVTLLEKLNQVGGRARVFKKDGFIFDAGPTVITAPFLFDELFKLFDKKRTDYVSFVELDPWYQFYFDDGRVFNYGGTIKDTEEEIKKFNYEDVKGYRKLVGMSEKIFNVGFNELSHVPFDNFWFMLKQIPKLVKLKSYLTVYQLVSKYIKNPFLKKALSIQPLLLGGNPISTTSIYNLIHFLERKWKVHYAVGGTGAIVKALKKLMVEESINVKTNIEVKKILFKDKKAIGVELLNDKKMFSDIVVFNGDPSHAYLKMIPQKLVKRWNKKKIEKLEFSMGLFVIFFGTDKIYNNVEHHTIWMGKRFEGLLKDIFSGDHLPDDFSLYLHRPTATDKTTAPKNCDSFYVLSPVPNLKSKICWQEEGESYKNKILKALENTILPGLSNHLKTCFYMTPVDFKNDYLSYNGSGFSISPIFSQSAWFRFNNKAEDFENLFFVGAGTHPGAGVPGVLSSAKVLENILKNKNGK